MSNDKIKLDSLSAAKLQWLDEEVKRHLKDMATIIAQAIKNDPKKVKAFNKDPVSYRPTTAVSTKRMRTFTICWGSGEGMGMVVEEDKDTGYGYMEPYDGC